MSPLRLSEASLHSVRSGTILPTYDRAATRFGIVHIGPGAFHRAHQAYYADTLLHSDKRWAICALSLKSTGLRDALEAQHGLYTLVELGAAPRARVIGAIRELLVGATDAERAFARLTSRDTRIVSMTVTEKGYCLDAKNLLDTANPDIVHDLAARAPGSDWAPRSTIGWIVEGLKRRRAAGLAPFTVLSCDNLQDNGKVLHRALVDFARIDDPELARWIEAEVVCPRTMVDSITPATDEALKKRALAITGVADEWPIQREPFTQWVVEDVPAMRDADWPSVGVTLAKDVGIYDRAKLRLVNGPHSTLTYLGLLRGHESVADAMRDEQLAKFVELLMTEDLAPSLGASPGFDIEHYISAILQRFRNPGIRHLLSQIAWDGSKKLPVRITTTLGEALRAGRPVHRLVMPIAAWMRFIARQAKAGVAIVDPDAARLAEIGKACTGDARADLARFAVCEAVLPATLLGDEKFRLALEAAYTRLAEPHSAITPELSL
ncbi:MAG TPA: mannitol dehydrogenase family protein [Steroidobacteraceae bacterium]|nr:mannitol dehydrogenase family protein [Steroidobacteraceae bacterium]